MYSTRVNCQGQVCPAELSNQSLSQTEARQYMTGNLSVPLKEGLIPVDNATPPPLANQATFLAHK